MVFRTKFQQAVNLIDRVARAFSPAKILVITDTWFGNNGLLKPLRSQLGACADILSRLRVNCVLYAIPESHPPRPGRPRKYGSRLGSVADMAQALQAQAKLYTLHVYSGLREVMAVDRVVMLKTLRCRVRVVWVYRKRQWVALVTTDLTLSVEQIIEYYSARWKIEAGFREIKQEIGSAATQTRNPDAVTNHLHFCMAATTITWIYAEHLPQAPARRYASNKTTEYAFADARRSFATALSKESFDIDCADAEKPSQNSLFSAVMRLMA